MTILWADGFEDWTSGTGEYTSGSIPSPTSVGRRGGKALSFSATNSASLSLPAALTEVFAAVSYSPQSPTSGRAVLAFFSGATAQVTVTWNSDGSLSAYRGAFSGTLLGSTAAGVVPNLSYAQIQCRVVISDTVGVVQIRLNGSGSNALSLTGIDTNNGAAAVSVNTVVLGTAGAATAAGYYDDFVVWNTGGSIANTWLGDVRVDSYFPNANGDSSQFVGSDGNSTDNYLLVDATSPNGTDYVQSSTVNDKDLYGFGNLTHTPSAIYGVLVAPSALKDDAGSRSIRVLAKSSATEVDSGADLALSTSRTRYTGLFETDPNTSAAWTKAGIDAAQFGVKVTV